MKNLKKLSLKKYAELSPTEMKVIFGGQGGYTCWCNNTNIGYGNSIEDCASKCVNWCNQYPSWC